MQKVVYARTIKKYLKANRLISSSLFVMIASMAVNVINYFYHLVFGRLLGPVDYGILASLYSLLYIVTIIPHSTSFAIVKFISSAKSLEEKRFIYSKINSLALKISIILSITILIFAYPITRFMNMDNYLYVMAISPILLLSIITLVNQATFQGLMEFKGLVIPNIISSVGKFVFGLILIFLISKVLGAILGVLLGVLIAYLYSFSLIREFKKGRSSGEFSTAKFIKFTFPILIQSMAFTSIFTTDLILVKHFLSAHEAGIYASLSMLGKIIYFSVSPVVSVMFPEISSRHSLGSSYKKVLVGSLLIAGFMCLGITSAYYIFPNFIVGSLYGKLFLEAGLSLPLMGIFISFYTLSYMIANFFLSIGITKISYIVLLASILQAVGIYIYHNSITEVINVSVFVMLIAFLVLVGFLVYNLNNESNNIKYAKK